MYVFNLICRCVVTTSNNGLVGKINRIRYLGERKGAATQRKTENKECCPKKWYTRSIAINIKSGC